MSTATKDQPELFSCFQRFADDCNRDVNYGHSHHAGLLLTELQTRWKRERPTEFVPYPYHSRTGKAVIVWSEADEMREGLRAKPPQIQTLKTVNVPSLLAGLRAVGVDSVALALVEELGKYQQHAQQLQLDLTALCAFDFKGPYSSENAADIGQPNGGSWLCLRYTNDEAAGAADQVLHKLSGARAAGHATQDGLDR